MRAPERHLSTCQTVGIVLRLDDGLLRRVRGQIVSFDEEYVVVGIPSGLARSEGWPLKDYEAKCSDP